MKNSFALKFSTLALIAVTFFGCEPDHVTISAIKVNKITILEYPMLTSGTPWDDPFLGSATGPDIYWTIVGPDNYTGTYFADCSGQALEYNNTNNGGLPVFLNSPNSTYTLYIYDKDGLDGSDLGSGDDLLAAVTVDPYTAGDDGVITYEYADGDMKAQIEFTYLFE